MNEHMVEETAAAIKKAYVDMRKFVQGRSKYTPASRWKSCWEKAAQLCMKLNAEPRKFVQIQFEKTKPFPMPNMLGSSAAERKYEDYKEFAEDDTKEAVAYQMDMITRKVSAGHTLVNVLSDESFQLDSLIRYIVALDTLKISESPDTEKLQAIVDNYKPLAKRQLMSNPMLFKVCAKFIPPDLREEHE